MKELLKLFEFTAGKIQELSESQSVTGETMVINGVTVIPVYKLSCGFTGGGSDLAGKTRWLDQLFARIPDVEKLDLELSIRRNGQKYRQIPVSVPVPGGKHLQQAGISLSPDMKVRLLLKNPQEQTQSADIPFLRD